MQSDREPMEQPQDKLNDTRASTPVDHDEKAEPAVENDQHRHNRAPIRNAHGDVESGLQDTERYARHPSDVPTSDSNDG